MRSKLLLSALTAALLAAQAATASPVTVKLEDMGPDLPFIFIQQVLPGFGSSGPVTLDWDPTLHRPQSLRYWPSDYSGRPGAWCEGGVDCALDLTVTTGNTVTLESFFLGGWPNTTRSIIWSVVDLATNTVVAQDASGSNVPGGAGLVVNVNKTSGTGFRILFGPDGSNGGINDITYSFNSVTPPPPPPATGVPLPGALLLLGAGLAGLGLVRHRA